MKKNTDNNMAFPRGTTWTPVETALSDLKKSLTMNLKCQKTEVSNSLGFILSEDVFAVILSKAFKFIFAIIFNRGFT